MAKNNVIHNAKWIIGCKILQAFLNLVIGMLSARYLGPSDYGLINYAASLVAFVVPIMQLGLRSTLVREIIVAPEKEGEILGTAVIMNMVSAVACVAMVISFSAVANFNEPRTILVCALYSTLLFFQAIEIMQYWFQAKLKSKYPSLAMLGGYVVASVYKLYLLITRKSVFWFVVTHTIESAIIAVALLVIYRRIGEQRLTCSRTMASELFSKSKYYIISSLMVKVFQNTDHIMIKLMIDDVANGYYTAAVTCAGVCTFVFAAIIDSARPVILESRQVSTEVFEKKLVKLYSIIIYAALLQSVAFTVLAKPIMLILYGSDYSAAIPVLRIVVWYSAFSYMGTVRNIWILSEGKQHVLWIVNLSGAVMNVILNGCLIPVMGASGAALASVLTQFFTNYVVSYFIKEIRFTNTFVHRALNLRLLAEMVSEYLGRNNVREK